MNRFLIFNGFPIYSLCFTFQNHLSLYYHMIFFFFFKKSSLKFWSTFWALQPIGHLGSLPSLRSCALFTYVPTFHRAFSILLNFLFPPTHKAIAISFFLFLCWPLNVAVPTIVMLPSPWVTVSLGTVTQMHIQERLNSVMCTSKTRCEL